MESVSWGVIGDAGIARHKVIPAMQRSRFCNVVAIGVWDPVRNRAQEKALRLAKDHAIPKAYGSYEELLEDTEIEAVYIPLPNHLHVLWTTKAARAGKHVLFKQTEPLLAPLAAGDAT